MDSNPPFDWNTTASSLQRIAAVDPLDAATYDLFLRRLVGYRRAVKRDEAGAARVVSGKAREGDLDHGNEVLEEIEPLRQAAKDAAAACQKCGKNSSLIAQLIPGVGLASDDKHFAAIVASIISLADAYDKKQNGGKPVDVDDDATLSPRSLADKWAILPLLGRLESRLKRFRESNPTGNGTLWIEVADAKPREAKFWYRVRHVRPILDAVKATGERPANDGRK